MDTLILAGNGLTIDFNTNVLHRNTSLDTRSPLKWKFRIKAAENRWATEAFVELYEAITFAKRKTPGLTDFEIIEQLSRICRRTPSFLSLIHLIRKTNGRWVGHLNNPHQQDNPLDKVGSILRYQLRLFLNTAFIHFHEISKQGNLNNWSWTRWMSVHAHRVLLICSFNYDLVIENTFRSVSRRPIRYLVGPGDYRHFLPVFKPHGSINFEVSKHAICFDENIYSSGNIFERNNTPITVVDEARLHESRISPDIVLPMEYSQITNFQYVIGGYQAVMRSASSIRYCVIGGLSFWEHDRPELNRIFQSLHPSTQIILVNPNPNRELLDCLKNRFASIQVTETVPPLLS